MFSIHKSNQYLKSKENLLNLLSISETRQVNFKTLVSFGAFYNTYSDNFLNSFSNSIYKSSGLNFQLDSEGLRKYDNCLFLPICDIMDMIVSWQMFDLNEYLTKQYYKSSKNYQLDPSRKFNVYKQQDKKSFDKSKFFFCKAGIQKKAIMDKYVLLVDGVFDCIQLQSLGFNTFSLLGSTLSVDQIRQLNYSGKVILIPDNDDAGEKLASKIKRYVVNSSVIRLPEEFKDVDELLKSSKEGSDKLINSLKKCISD